MCKWCYYPLIHNIISESTEDAQKHYFKKDQIAQ